MRVNSLITAPKKESNNRTLLETAIVFACVCRCVSLAQESNPNTSRVTVACPWAFRVVTGWHVGGHRGDGHAVALGRADGLRFRHHNLRAKLRAQFGTADRNLPTHAPCHF